MMKNLENKHIYILDHTLMLMDDSAKLPKHMTDPLLGVNESFN